MKQVLVVIGLGLAITVMCIAMSLLLAWPFMWIWNYAVCGALSIATTIDYWRAFWLLTFMWLFMKSSSAGSK